MMRSAAVAGIVLGLLGTACSSSTGGTTPGTCSVTASGSVSTAITCQVAAATTANTGGKVAFGLEGSSGNTSVIAIQVILNETSLQTGTYGSSSGTSVVSASGAVDLTSGQSWLQFFQQAGVPDQGSFSLTISSTGSSVPSGNYTGWPDPGGTITMTLEPVAASGSTGTVTINATF